MADEQRNSKTVEAEYNNLAFRCGHLQIEIVRKQAELKAFNETLDNLQREYSELKAKELKEEQASQAKEPDAILPPEGKTA
jgi:predicted nuclease with TOPRIM domain